MNFTLSLLKAGSLSTMFDELFDHPKLEIADTIEDFFELAQNNIFVGYKRENDYVSGNYSLLLNIPYLINDNDQIIKSFQFIRGFSNHYEIKIMNYKTDQTVFGISDIIRGRGVLSIKYNNRTDSEVFKDPKIKNGTDVMILGLGIAYLFGINLIILGDKATVNCDYQEKYPLRLTLFKNIIGQAGFYQKFGFQWDTDLTIYFEMLGNAFMSEVLTIFGEEVEGEDITVREYIYSLTLLDEIGNTNCQHFSNLLENIVHVKSCESVDDHLQQLCEAIVKINDGIEHQEKKISFEDYTKMINKF